jgi:hypothetical protein
MANRFGRRTMAIERHSLERFRENLQSVFRRIENQMSKLFIGAALFVAMTSTYAGAADTAESLKQGDPIGPFMVTKVAGAEDDGVETGESLCYRCRYGSRPMVMVFSRDAGASVAKLVKEIDSAVSANPDSELKGLVTLLGKDRDQLKQQASQLIQDSGAKHVPMVISEDPEHGPSDYGIDAAADVTVIVANDSQVVATHTFNADSVDAAKVMSEVKQLLN